MLLVVGNAYALTDQLSATGAHYADPHDSLWRGADSAGANHRNRDHIKWHGTLSNAESKQDNPCANSTAKITVNNQAQRSQHIKKPGNFIVGLFFLWFVIRSTRIWQTSYKKWQQITQFVSPEKVNDYHFSPANRIAGKPKNLITTRNKNRNLN